MQGERDVTTPLEGSIRSWEHKLQTEDPLEINMGMESCPLCEAHYSEEGGVNTCGKCPVAVASSQEFCEGTPYIKAYRTWGRWKSEQGSRDAWLKACSEEITFLKSLRDTPTHDKDDDAS